MKSTVKVSQTIEMGMPPPSPVCSALASLRQVVAEYEAELRRLYPLADKWIVTEAVIYCDEWERARASLLPGFVSASDFGQVRATRADFGACEIFRFKWKH